MQPAKARNSIFFTPSGITILVNPVQPAKAELYILVTDVGIIVDWNPSISSLDFVFIIALQFSRESYTLLPSATTMLVNLVQPAKARKFIFFTPSGITTLVNPVQT